MKTLGLVMMALLLCLFTSESVNAQTATGNNTLTLGIPGLALLATDVAPVSLELTTSTAGAQISGGAGTTHVQVSSIVASGATRKITASVTGVPTGTSLAVSAVVPSNANYGGTVGTGLSSVDLINAAAAVDLVTGIGSCFTGSASDDGYTLNYAWNAGAVSDYGSIVELSGGSATVVLTITEDI